MNREDIIRMAKEAGFEVLLPSEEVFGRGGVYTGSDDEISKYIERFAALVIANHPPQSFMTWQEGYEAGKQTEREACAKLCEEEFDTGLVMAPVAPNLAAKIRARGQA